MKLLANWRDVLAKAWSVRFWALATLFTFLEVSTPFLEGMLPVSRGIFAILAGLFSVGGLVSRFLAQKDLPDG